MKNILKYIVLLSAVIMAFLLVSCDDDVETDTGSGTDTQTDTFTDTNTGSADTDTDTDTDTVTDSGSETGSADTFIEGENMNEDLGPGWSVNFK